MYAQDLVQVHGYIQGRFTDQEGTPDRLEIRRARLIVTGEPASNLSYRFQVDFAKSPYLMDASISYKLSTALSISAGQMKIPFSAESVISDDRNPPVSRSRAVLALSPGRDTGVQGRDVGLQTAGAFGARNRSWMEYSAGVFRGQTFVNAPKVHYNATAGRAIFHPVRGLSAGADWYGSFSAPAAMVKRREDLEAEYHWSKLLVRGEQIWARDGTLRRRGGYLLGAWRLSDRWEAVARADWLTKNAAKPDTASIAYITGGNLYVFKHIKVGLNGGTQWNQNSRAWSSVLVAQIMAYF